MSTRKSCDSYTTRVLAGLVVTVAIAFGSLVHAVANVQTFI